MKIKQKWQRRSFATDFIVKGLFCIILFVVLLFSFNYAISGSLYASEFWDMIGGVLAFIASLLATLLLRLLITTEGFFGITRVADGYHQ